MNEDELKTIAAVMIKVAHENAADDALGVSEMYEELTDEEVQAVVELIRRATLEVSW